MSEVVPVACQPIAVLFKEENSNARFSCAKQHPAGCVYLLHSGAEFQILLIRSDSICSVLILYKKPFRSVFTFFTTMPCSKQEHMEKC